MKNITMNETGTILTITVDLSKEFGPSASGKTIIVASSEGNKSLGGQFTNTMIGLNVYRK